MLGPHAGANSAGGSGKNIEALLVSAGLQQQLAEALQQAAVQAGATAAPQVYRVPAQLPPQSVSNATLAGLQVTIVFAGMAADDMAARRLGKTLLEQPSIVLPAATFGQLAAYGVLLNGEPLHVAHGPPTWLSGLVIALSIMALGVIGECVVMCT